jgi:hypothetical protein
LSLSRKLASLFSSRRGLSAWRKIQGVSYDGFMSKNQWGVLVGIFVSIAIQFAPVPDRLKWGITIAALVLAIVCGIGWWRAPSYTKETRDRLGDFLSAGEFWKRRCENPGDIFPGDQMAKWRKDVERYVLSRLGASYEARLTSDSGIILEIPKSVPKEYDGSWWALHVRCVRLHDFIKELS